MIQDDFSLFLFGERHAFYHRRILSRQFEFDSTGIMTCSGQSMDKSMHYSAWYQLIEPKRKKGSIVLNGKSEPRILNRRACGSRRLARLRFLVPWGTKNTSEKYTVLFVLCPMIACFGYSLDTFMLASLDWASVEGERHFIHSARYSRCGTISNTGACGLTVFITFVHDTVYEQNAS